MQQLAGKTAVITGAASGIGLALAEHCAREKMHVVMADVEPGALSRAAGQLAQQAPPGVRILPVVTDVSIETQLMALAARTFEEFGTAHLLCNNAGVNARGFNVWETPPAAWQWIFEVNLWGVVYGLRAFMPRFIAQNEGHVVNTASLGSMQVWGKIAPYCMTKHALVGLSESLFVELHGLGSSVGVSLLCPGVTSTNIADAGRNWPARLGPRPAVDETKLMADIANSVMATAGAGENDGPMAPGPIAELVIEAVRTRRFLVAPRPGLARRALQARLNQVDGGDPLLT